jgi:hypothetical protein
MVKDDGTTAEPRLVMPGGMALASFALALMGLAPSVTGCGGPATRTAAPATGGDWFVDAASSTGLDFVQRSGRTGSFYLPEIMGSGAALFDYDQDGDLDAYLVQAGRLEPPGDASGRSSAPRVGPEADRLYRNELVERGALAFTDVTSRSGIATRGYGQGVAAGDVDNDGFPDLYVTSFGPSQLLRNQGDGTFRDVTARGGAHDERWSTSAAFFDYDRDGWLDLYVANYVDFVFPVHKPCFSVYGKPDYCSPTAFLPSPHRLLRNRGDLTFEDVSEKARILTVKGNGLGVSTADFDGDGWIDVYVANDQMENFLWLNQRDGTFQNVGLERGAALSFDGSPEASMGVDGGDFDDDGDEDLYLTHLTGQKNTLYVNEGSGVFTDRTFQSGLGGPGQKTTGFGTAWLDFDNDGHLDLLVVNGTVFAIEALARAGDSFPYRQQDQLFRNLGDGRFREVTAQAGAAFQVPGASRGAAFGDVDNDGDIDVLVNRVDAPARLLLNRAEARGHWLGVRLMSKGRDALGARAVLRREGLRPLWRRARADGSYCSANDPRILFGLGGDSRGGVLEVFWPDGRRERFRDLAPGRYSEVVQGRGEPIP